MSVRVGRYLIYGLIDPRDRSLRYIGKTHKRREWRLAEHIQHALDGDQRPVYGWIRELLANNLEPEIFVWKRVPADADWRIAEKEAIAFWRGTDSPLLPYVHPSQTSKSMKTLIRTVSLLNATSGG
jgi:hypothetical protein